jgi:hypothetical protein
VRTVGRVLTLAPPRAARSDRRRVSPSWRRLSPHAAASDRYLPRLGRGEHNYLSAERRAQTGQTICCKLCVSWQAGAPLALVSVSFSGLCCTALCTVHCVLGLVRVSWCVYRDESTRFLPFVTLRFVKYFSHDPIVTESSYESPRP